MWPVRHDQTQDQAMLSLASESICDVLRQLEGSRIRQAHVVGAPWCWSWAVRINHGSLTEVLVHPSYGIHEVFL